MNVFAYEFMQKAFLVGTILSIIIPMIGVVVVLKRLSMIGDALSHSSLAGITAGLAFGFNPILGAVLSTLIASFSIEAVRKKFPQFEDISIAIIMSLGVSAAGIISGFVKNASGFSSFLFGSIVAISDFELYFVIATGLLVGLMMIFLYRELFFMSLDERGAILAGVPVKIVGTIFTILTALTVAIAARTVGTLIVSSMMVIPVAASMQISKSYKQTFLYAIAFALFSTLTGLIASFYLDLKPGSTIALISIIILIIILVGKGGRRKHD